MPINVFVSRPSWIPPECTKGITALEQLLNTLDLTARRVGGSDQPTRTPLDDVIDVMKECSGAIILGVPQLVADTGALKGVPLTQRLTLGTEWNHIEAGLAHASGLPLLVIHDIVVSRGIFDRGSMNTFLYQKDFTRSDWPLDPDVQGALQKWKRELTPRG